MNHNLLAGNALDSAGERFLHRGLARLYLPASVIGAVIGEDQFEIRRQFSFRGAASTFGAGVLNLQLLLNKRIENSSDILTGSPILFTTGSSGPSGRFLELSA